MKGKSHYKENEGVKTEKETTLSFAPESSKSEDPIYMQKPPSDSLKPDKNGMF